MINIAINGFGRIGRAALKHSLKNRKINVVAINDLYPVESLAYLLKYDSSYGIYNDKVSNNKLHITVGNKKIAVLNEKDPAKLPWKKYKVDVVLECTGVFTKKELSELHIEAGAKKVIISAPAKGERHVSTYLKGVNHTKIKNNEKVISNASCTTNCAGPIMEILQRNFGIKNSFLTTIHAVTAKQSIQDVPNKDFRRGRAAMTNMIPTTTGAAIATAKVLPVLDNRFDGIAVRVPVLIGSLTDFTVLLNKKCTVDKINNAFIKASKSKQYKGILGVTKEPLVSSDIVGTEESAIVDLSFTKLLGGNFAKILAWYDNEWAYAKRLVEMAEIFTKK